MEVSKLNQREVGITPEQILYEDNHLIVVNKRAGQIVQGDKTQDVCMADEIREYIRVRDHKPGNVYCGVVHRLDRPVSGAVLFAKTSKALTRMNAQIKEHATTKIYWAITKEAPFQLTGHIDNWLKRNEKLNKSFIVNEGTDGAKLASLNYRVIATSKGGYHLIEVELLTGRHHQIRCQLANLGCPIKGDLKYGYSRSNPDGSICLHSHCLEFIHPVRREPVKVIAPAPSAFDIFEI